MAKINLKYLIIIIVSLSVLMVIAALTISSLKSSPTLDSTNKLQETSFSVKQNQATKSAEPKQEATQTPTKNNGGKANFGGGDSGGSKPIPINIP